MAYQVVPPPSGRADLAVASMLALFAQPHKFASLHAMPGSASFMADLDRWSTRPVMRWIRRHGANESKVVMELEGGLTTTYRIRQDGGESWLSLEAAADGNAKKVADELNARAKGWEFRVGLYPVGPSHLICINPPRDREVLCVSSDGRPLPL